MEFFLMLKRLLMIAALLAYGAAPRAQAWLMMPGPGTPAGGGGITLVNSAGGTGTAGSAAASAINVASGNLLAVGCNGQGNDPSTTISVSDTAGNTFTQVAVVNDSQGEAYLFYAKNTIANASDVVTCTSTFSGDVTAMVSQYSGL